MAYIFHYTRAENYPGIQKKGLRPQSKFLFLGSRLRRDAVYGWLHPNGDRMGHKGNPDYICLRLEVASAICVVAPMELASAAYVCFRGLGRPPDPDLAEWLIRQYDRLAVPLEEYEPGSFLNPEVLVRAPISPNQITLAQEWDFRRRRLDEHRFYRERVQNRLSVLAASPESTLKEILSHLGSEGRLELLAIHDDIDGLIYTYRCPPLDFLFSIHERFLSP